MQFRFIIRQLGLLLLVLSMAMVAVLLWAYYDGSGGEHPASGIVTQALLWSTIAGLVGGLVLMGLGRGGTTSLGRREALLLVALSWIVGAMLAALPFRLWAAFQPEAAEPAAMSNFVDCYFEAMSGLTTTGATVLTDVSGMPRGLLLWRALTHWMGGLGIVVLFVAVFPVLGVGGKRLFKIEAPGPSTEGVTPRIQETARMLWFIYLGLTLAEILALKLCDSAMTWFDAVTHTFATLATGGFSTMNASAGGFGPAVQWVLVLFMVLAGINFGIYHQLLSGRWRQALGNGEFRAYLMIILIATVIIMLDLGRTVYPDTTGTPITPTATNLVRDAMFQVVSIQTTTGFCSVNFEQWPILAKTVLVLLMFVGGCGGSTAGGIKVVRILVVFKVMIVELERAFRPNVIRPLRLGAATVDDQQRLAILAYVLGILVLFAMGTAALVWTDGDNGIDGVTAATATIATLNNVGPGLARVGAVENYAWFSNGGKLVMCLLMALGRLEVFAILVIFMPRFWRAN